RAFASARFLPSDLPEFTVAGPVALKLVRPVVLGHKRPRQAAADAQEAPHKIRERLNTMKAQTCHQHNKLRAHRRLAAVEATRGFGLLPASSASAQPVPPTARHPVIERFAASTSVTASAFDMPSDLTPR